MGIDRFIASFAENCAKIEAAAKKAGKESCKLFVETLKKAEQMNRLNLPKFAEWAHEEATMLDIEAFAETVRAVRDAFKSGNAEMISAAFDKLMHVDPGLIRDFDEIVRENTGKPSVASMILPFLTRANDESAEQSAENADEPETVVEVQAVEVHPEEGAEKVKEELSVQQFREDGEVVSKAWERVKKIEDAIDTGSEEKITAAVLEFHRAEDGEAIRRFNDALNGKLTEEHYDVIRNMCEKNEYAGSIDWQKWEKSLPAKGKPARKNAIEITSYSEWKSSWKKER